MTKETSRNRRSGKLSRNSQIRAKLVNHKTCYYQKYAGIVFWLNENLPWDLIVCCGHIYGMGDEASLILCCNYNFLGCTINKQNSAGFSVEIVSLIYISQLYYFLTDVIFDDRITNAFHLFVSQIRYGRGWFQETQLHVIIFV